MNQSTLSFTVHTHRETLVGFKNCSRSQSTIQLMEITNPSPNSIRTSVNLRVRQARLMEAILASKFHGMHQRIKIHLKTQYRDRNLWNPCTGIKGRLWLGSLKSSIAFEKGRTKGYTIDCDLKCLEKSFKDHSQCLIDQSTCYQPVGQPSLRLWWFKQHCNQPSLITQQIPGMISTRLWSVGRVKLLFQHFRAWLRFKKLSWSRSLAVSSEVMLYSSSCWIPGSPTCARPP